MSDEIDKSIKLLDIKIDKLKEKEKSSEDFETYEGVLDGLTLKTLYKLAKKGVITHLYGVLSTGKEANVYWGKKDQEDYAVKVYRTSTLDFKKLRYYIIGDPRFKSIKKSVRPLIYAWALKEFKNLKRAFEAKVRVPEPVIVKNNVLIMEFIGENGKPAPLMKDVELRHPSETYATILDYMRKLYRKANLVHADLSEFNILMFNDEPVIIDLSQATLLSHPQAREYLLRDIKNINRFFEARGLNTKSTEEILRFIIRD